MTNEENHGEKQKNVVKASRAKNPMEHMQSALQFVSQSGQRYTLYGSTKADLDSKVLKWAFKLAERNVGSFYKQLKMGWQPKVKQNDLNKNWARYLVAVDEKRTPVAYSMFRFDMDYGCNVLYCYEMQIEPSHHRQGLGKYMMNLLESCALHWQMEKVVLTVLNNNDPASAFFKAIGYTLDDSSPDQHENAEYEILSKLTQQ